MIEGTTPSELFCSGIIREQIEGKYGMQIFEFRIV